jgi:hypothetical protein
VWKKLIFAIENNSKHEELVWSQEGGSAETLHQCGHRWEQFIARRDREYNPELEGGHRHSREAVSEMIQHIFHIWGGGGGLTFGIDWGILHICVRNYQVLMMGEGWGKKCSASYVTGREDTFILVESITISLMN